MSTFLNLKKEERNFKEGFRVEQTPPGWPKDFQFLHWKSYIQWNFSLPGKKAGALGSSNNSSVVTAVGVDHGN